MIKKYISRINELFVFFLYLFLIIFIMCFHEPWFDEAESWLIARDSSYYEILFVRPHFEGHPPFWWLLLSVPAKLGIPYEIGLKSVQFCTTVLMSYMLLFKSPFKLLIKVLFLFSYFLFFQYGVTSRPYALLCFAIFLCADFWKDRNNHPFHLISSLILLCLSNAYGIVIAGGIAICWTVEAITDKTLFIKRNRFLGLFILLVIAFILIAEIWPASNAYGTGYINPYYENSALQRLYYFWFCIPSELFITELMNETLLNTIHMDLVNTICLSIISLFFWVIMVKITRNRRILIYLLVPYGLLSCIAAFKYFSIHHIGILYAFVIFIMWISEDLQHITIDEISEIVILIKIEVRKGLSGVLYKCIKPVLYVILSISVYWSIMASFNDIRFNYSSSRVMRDFIQDNQLQDLTWMSAWRIHPKIPIDPEDDAEIDMEDIEFVDNTHELEGNPLIITNPYFDKNLIINSYKDYSFASHESETSDQAKNEIDEWSKSEDPAFFTCQNIYFEHYAESLNLDKDNYILFLLTETRSAWKSKTYYNEIYTYIRKDIYIDVLGSPQRWFGYK